MEKLQKIVVLCSVGLVVIVIGTQFLGDKTTDVGSNDFDIVLPPEDEPNEETPVACTMEAKQCPDGSYVGRTGPNCEFSPCPGTVVDSDNSRQASEKSYEEFQFELEEAVRIEIGQPIEGYEPQMFMQVFPGLKPWDFDGVDAQIGYYLYHHGQLNHEYEVGTLLHSAATAITEEGFGRLLENVTYRLGYDDSSMVSVEEVIEELRLEKNGSSTVSFPIRYGEDASRIDEYRSDCEQKMGVFNSCGSACGPEAEVCIDVCSMICEGPADEHMPPVPVESTFCTPESRSVDACIEIYQPVCGFTQVECITAPCDPVPETYSNSCFACSNDRVISYTNGACEQ